MPEIQITMSDRDRQIVVRPGDTLVISLDENLTTGYEWKVASVSSQIVELIDNRYLQKTRVALGGGGTRRGTLPGKSPRPSAGSTSVAPILGASRCSSRSL